MDNLESVKAAILEGLRDEIGLLASQPRFWKGHPGLARVFEGWVNKLDRVGALSVSGEAPPKEKGPRTFFYAPDDHVTDHHYRCTRCGAEMNFKRVRSSVVNAAMAAWDKVHDEAHRYLKEPRDDESWTSAAPPKEPPAPETPQRTDLPRPCLGPETRSVEEILLQLHGDLLWVQALPSKANLTLELMPAQVVDALRLYREEKAASETEREKWADDMRWHVDWIAKWKALEAERDEARARINEAIEVLSGGHPATMCATLCGEARRILRGGESTEGET